MSLSSQQDPTSLEEAFELYQRCPDGDLEARDEILRRIVRMDQTQEWAWFDLGLHAKWRRDWAAAFRYTERALSVARTLRQNPAAWNLGIAATALEDWVTARRAWTAFGVMLPPGVGPIEADLGPTPIRLNPDPRFPGQTPLEIEGRYGSTEVVWCRRICPARAVVTNVPMPESRHRFGDVVLHDGDPVGRREARGEDYPVFDELTLVSASSLPTLSVTVRCPSAADARALIAEFRSAHLAAEDWSPTEADDPWHPERSFGLAAPEYTAATILGAWRAGGYGRGHDVPVRRY
jgi:hypothetical protein